MKSENISLSLSNNQVYPQVCLQASIDYLFFNNFRRNPVYNEILEHVNFEQGLEYLDIIIQHPQILREIEKFRLNDLFGNPVVYNFPEIGLFSPSTLRYVKVLCDLQKHFKSLDSIKICEIGVGYGGQCRIINSFFTPASYCLVDIKPALSLSQTYLDNFIINSSLSYLTMNELAVSDYDLVISNYAFTELPLAIQDVYFKKIIKNSRMGYITYNDINPPEYCSYKLPKLLDLITSASVFPEKPLTHPNNCIIVW
jgi:putative sugar O-methyltransferase